MVQEYSAKEILGVRDVLTNAKQNPNTDTMNALLVHPIVSKRISIICSVLTTVPEVKELLVQEVLIKIWKHLGSFEPDYSERFGKFFAWIGSIAKHQFLDDLRRIKRSRETEHFEEMNEEALKRFKSEPMEEFEYPIRRREMWEKIWRLPKNQQMVVILSLEGDTLTTIREKFEKLGTFRTEATFLAWYDKAYSTLCDGRKRITNRRAPKRKHVRLEQ